MATTSSIKPKLAPGQPVVKLTAAKKRTLKKQLENLSARFAETKGEIDAASKAVSPEIKKLSDKIDSMSELGEMESLKLQMAMDRLSKMITMLSNIMKKMHESSMAIISNIK